MSLSWPRSDVTCAVVRELRDLGDIVWDFALVGLLGHEGLLAELGLFFVLSTESLLISSAMSVTERGLHSGL